jgi:transposase InsO family protein
MAEDGLRVYTKRRRKYSSYQGEISPAPENLIARDFHADKPSEKWLTDITEFHIPAGKMYLSPIIDCFDGLVVNWTISTHPTADIVNSMLEKAACILQKDEHPIVHSDRGDHYR